MDTTVIVGLAVILAKIIEKMLDFGINHFKPSEDNPIKLIKETNSLITQTASMIKSISDLLGKVDLNGTPMVYYSRSLEIKQTESLNVLNDLTSGQNAQLKMLEKITDKVLEIEKDISHVLYQLGGK